MKSRLLTILALTSLVALIFIADPSRAEVKMPRQQNLAASAQITSNSEYSGQYLAKFVAEGQVPAAGSRADLSKAWCVKGETHRNNAELVFQWQHPVTVAAIVYYGRTAWYYSECWKDYEVIAGDVAQPIAKGQLKCGHGPQVITLENPIQASKLTLKFVSSYGGPNPGASEVQVLDITPPASSLDKFVEAASGPATSQPAAVAVSAIEESPAMKAMLMDGGLGFQQLVAVQRQSVKPSHVYTYHAEGLSPGGGLDVFTLTSNGIESKRLVDAPEGVILDCNISWDGKRVLFSWKKTMQDLFQVYCIDLDGSNLRQITDDSSNNMNGCWLPDGGIAFLSDRKPAYAYCWVTTSPILYRCDSDGTNVVRLSANYLNDFTPSVMADGRILYSRWEYVDRPAIPIQSLWTINPDGTGLSGFFGNRILSPATFMEAREIRGTKKILCVLTSHNGPCRGAIGLIDPSHGANSQEAIQNLTPEINIGQVSAGNGNSVRGPYESPFPIDTDYFLVSRDGTILLRDYAGTGQVTLLERDGVLGYYSAQPVQTRPVATQRAALRKPSTGDDWATVVVQDVYQGLENYVTRGEVKQIAVVQEVEKSRRAETKYRAFGFQFPVVSCGATYAPKKVWGYAKVESDGSAHFRVPTRRPIYFMALDEHGRALQRMRTFTHFMPGEQQSCIGCHSDRNYAAPSERIVSLASQRRPEDLTPPEWGVRGFSYTRIVQPIWDEHCVRCHNAIETGGGVDLSGDRTDIFCVSYETLARAGTGAVNPDIGGFGPANFGKSPYTSWIATYNGMESNILQIQPREWGSPASKLADLILAGHPDSEGVSRVQLTQAEQRRVFAWIDLNVPYYGTSESNHYDVKGCRQLQPETLATVLGSVAKRRCASCHQDGKIPRQFYTRITNVECNSFLLAPLAKSAGGTEACGEIVFRSKEDPDYQAILKTFDSVQRTIESNPRMDMIGAEMAGQ